jgi:hypothetical protein
MPVSDARHQRKGKEERNREKGESTFQGIFEGGRDERHAALQLNLGLHIIDYQEYFTVTGL